MGLADRSFNHNIRRKVVVLKKGKRKNRQRKFHVSQIAEFEKARMLNSYSEQVARCIWNLSNSGEHFSVTTSGASTTTVNVFGRKPRIHRFVRTANRIDGSHISARVRADIDTLLPPKKLPETAEEIITKQHPDHITYNILGLKKALEADHYIHIIDINDAYWTSAWLLGLISRSTFLDGLIGDTWKQARNAALGGLDTSKKVCFYRNGILKPYATRVSRAKKNYRYARAAVVNYIAELGAELMAKLKFTPGYLNPAPENANSPFLWSVVDAFAVTGAGLMATMEFLREKGFVFSIQSALIESMSPHALNYRILHTDGEGNITPELKTVNL